MCRRGLRSDVYRKPRGKSSSKNSADLRSVAILAQAKRLGFRCRCGAGAMSRIPSLPPPPPPCLTCRRPFCKCPKSTNPMDPMSAADGRGFRGLSFWGSGRPRPTRRGAKPPTFAGASGAPGAAQTPHKDRFSFKSADPHRLNPIRQLPARLDPPTVHDRRRARSTPSASASTSTEDLLLRVAELEAVVKRYKKDVTLRACYHVRFRVRSDMSGRSTIASHVISAGAA